MLFRKKKYVGSGSLSYLAWKRFKRNRLSFFFSWIIILSIFLSLLGYQITPDSSPFANEQFLELNTKKPGFNVDLLLVKKNEKSRKTNFLKKMLFGKTSEFKKIPILNYEFDGADIIIEKYTGSDINGGEKARYTLADIVYPLSIQSNCVAVKGETIQITTFNGQVLERSITDLKRDVLKNHISKKRYLLGSDKFGRDLLSQLLIGTRVSLSIGFISVFISLLVGIVLGALAGFFRGWIDNIIVWFINVIWSIPTLLLVIAITFALGKGFWQVFIAVGLTMWVEVARVVRGQIFSIREKEFVEAGKALGFSNLRIIFRHIIPNVMGPVIVISAANFAAAILIEAGLSFLGLGVQPPTPSWGTMIKENYPYIILDSAYLAILPGVAIMLMVLSFMIVGNGLRDALDVKTVNE